MTQQEIVKALRNAMTVSPAMMDATADLIESMAADNQRKDEEIAAMTAELETICHQLEKVKRERDAAVKDFECCIAKGDDSICEYCKYRYTAAEEHCLDCDGDSFKWRGVTEEGGAK